VAIGDTVLAIGEQGSWYAIGVLQGTGATTLAVPGDLNIRAPRGSIELSAVRGIRIKSPRVDITAKKLQVAARAILERFTEATRCVKQTFRLRIGRFRTRVGSIYDLKADRILERAEADIKIDGRKIHLG
jgi:hypothetical protein